MRRFFKKFSQKHIIFLYLVAAAIIGLALFFLYCGLFGAPQTNAEPERFVVDLSTGTSAVVDQLKSDGFVKNESIFKIVFWLKGGRKIEPGGYKISKSMDVWQVAHIFVEPEYMKWVVISEGLRKEEIADILAKDLNWTDDEKQKWIDVYTSADYDHTEGVYFPDTYLIPIDEKPVDTAKRLAAKFEEKFASYAKGALEQNIKWTTLLKVASIIQKEAAGKDDMRVISGILWNRLDKNMKLDIDVTLQYIKGNEKIGWWPVLRVKDKQIDSPYNTYKYEGLPPHPIDNPGLEAIDAALNPQKTDCLYYIHDSSRKIHCSATYDEHLENIETYLQ